MKRICILGSYSTRVDEGMANVSYYLYHNLRIVHEAEFSLLDLHDVWTGKFWRIILSSKVDILHFIPGPTIKIFTLAKILQIFTRSKLVISATRPDLPDFFKKISWLFRPDIVIVQSEKSGNLFKGVDYKTAFIPNGVDTQRFGPVDLPRKLRLRKEYGFEDNDFIMLHIGPLREGRNQKSLLQFKNEKILLIVSITNPSEEEAYQDFKDSPNVTIWKTYFPNIQDIYAIADVYIFPVFKELSSIDIPLSVLEALSCNLPVITTKFGGLDRILEAGDGLFFVENETEIKDIITELRKGKIKTNTRQKILKLRLSWRDIALSISNIYESMKDRH